MKAVIFAGGVGTRLWPLSRKKTPKQFEKIIGDKSTLQLAVERLRPEFSFNDIYISTGKDYVDLVKKQINAVPEENIIGEPEKKDVGPAVCFMMGHLAQKYPGEPVIILWSDHLIHNEKKFKQILKNSDKFIKKNPDKIIFIGQKPRFASENLGWIEHSKTTKEIEGIYLHSFLGFKYRPDKKLAEQYFKSGRYCWNLGYFVSTPQFIYNSFKKYAPEIYHLTQKIISSFNQKNFNAYYHQMSKINFDNAVLEQLDPKRAYVVVEDIGWSDVGAWEALKEALQQKREDNIIKGNVLLENSYDNLVYNYEGKKIAVGIDLENLLVVNTADVLLVSKKSSVSKIKKLVESFEGTEKEHLT